MPKEDEAEWMDTMNNVHASVRPLFIDRLRKYLDRHVVPNVRSEGNKGRRSRTTQKLARLVSNSR